MFVKVANGWINTALIVMITDGGRATGPGDKPITNVGFMISGEINWVPVWSNVDEFAGLLNSLVKS